MEFTQTIREGERMRPNKSYVERSADLHTASIFKLKFAFRPLLRSAGVCRIPRLGDAMQLAASRSEAKLRKVRSTLDCEIRLSGRIAM